MQAFDFFLYALAIIAVLLLRAESAPATVATAPAPLVDDLPTLGDLLTEAAEMTAKPVPSVAAGMAAPVAVAVMKVATEAPASLDDLKTPELRRLCSAAGIRWRKAHGTKHLRNAEMIQALKAIA